MTLETERLILRHWEPDDACSLYESGKGAALHSERVTPDCGNTADRKSSDKKRVRR